MDPDTDLFVKKRVSLVGVPRDRIAESDKEIAAEKEEQERLEPAPLGQAFPEPVTVPESDQFENSNNGRVTIE